MRQPEPSARRRRPAGARGGRGRRSSSPPRTPSSRRGDLARARAAWELGSGLLAGLGVREAAARRYHTPVRVEADRVVELGGPPGERHAPTAAPLWFLGRGGGRARRPPGPPFELAEALQGPDAGEVAALEIGPTRDLTRPEDVVAGELPVSLGEGAMSETTYDLYQQGREHLAAGMNAQATVALEKAKRREPEKASIREALGIAYFRIRRFAEAEAEFRAILELQPVDHYAHFALGRCLEKQNGDAEAVGHLRLATFFRPQSRRVPPALDRPSASSA